MAQFVVRNLEEHVAKKLKQRAKRLRGAWRVVDLRELIAGFTAGRPTFALGGRRRLPAVARSAKAGC